MENDIRIILSKNVALSVGEEPYLNTIAVGDIPVYRSLVPNLLQMDRNYVVSDPSGSLYEKYAGILRSSGYTVCKLDFTNPESTWHYNPFDHMLRSDGTPDEDAVVSMASVFAGNITRQMETQEPGRHMFQTIKDLIAACSLMILEFYPKEDRNLCEMLSLVHQFYELDTGNTLFDTAREVNPDALCLIYYDMFCMALDREAAAEAIVLFFPESFADTPLCLANTTTTAYKVATRNLEGQVRTFDEDASGNVIVFRNNTFRSNIFIDDLRQKQYAVFIVGNHMENMLIQTLYTIFYTQLFDSLMDFEAGEDVPHIQILMDGVSKYLYTWNGGEICKKLKGWKNKSVSYLLSIHEMKYMDSFRNLLFDGLNLIWSGSSDKETSDTMAFFFPNENEMPGNDKCFIRYRFGSKSITDEYYDTDQLLSGFTKIEEDVEEEKPFYAMRAPLFRFQVMDALDKILEDRKEKEMKRAENLKQRFEDNCSSELDTLSGIAKKLYLHGVKSGCKELAACILKQLEAEDVEAVKKTCRRILNATSK